MSQSASKSHFHLAQVSLPMTHSYICNYKYIYIQIPMCIYFNSICNTVHSYLGNWVIHKYSMCSFSKLPNHAAISIGRCTHIVFTHSEHTHTHIYIYICIHIIDYNFIEHIFLYYTWIYALYNFIFIYIYIRCIRSYHSTPHLSHEALRHGRALRWCKFRKWKRPQPRPGSSGQVSGNRGNPN